MKSSLPVREFSLPSAFFCYFFLDGWDIPARIESTTSFKHGHVAISTDKILEKQGVHFKNFAEYPGVTVFSFIVAAFDSGRVQIDVYVHSCDEPRVLSAGDHVFHFDSGVSSNDPDLARERVVAGDQGFFLLVNLMCYLHEGKPLEGFSAGDPIQMPLMDVELAEKLSFKVPDDESGAASQGAFNFDDPQTTDGQTFVPAPPASATT